MNRKRITYIHQHFSLPSEGGGGRPWEFSRRLAADGYQVTVVAGGTKNEDLLVNGVRIIRLESSYRNEMGPRARIASFLKFMAKACLTAVKLPTDLVFASSTPITVAVPGLICSTFRRAPFVFEVRDLWPSVPARLGYLNSKWMLRIAQALERHTYRRAAKVIALSPGMREGVLQTHPYADVAVIPNAADIEIFRVSAERRAAYREKLGWTERKVAVYAGSFGESYRIDWLVELALRCEAASIQIFGEGSATTKMQDRLVAADVAPDSVLRGKVGKLELAEHLAAADVCISSILNHPSLHSNSLNKVFDALAAGRPVVFNHDGWLSDTLVRAGAGWRLEDDPSIAAEQLDAILNDTAALESAAEAACALAESFSRDRLYQDFVRALRPLLNEGVPKQGSHR